MILNSMSEFDEIRITLIMSPYEQVLQPDNKSRRSQRVHTPNFTFSRSNMALNASFEVRRLASRGECFGKTMQWEASRGTSKLATTAACEPRKVKLEVCTYWERRGLLSGCKICRFDDMAGSEVKS